MISAFISRLRPAPEQDQAARVFARLFHSDDGKFLLDYLHRHIVFRHTQPDISEHELRFLEGQRSHCQCDYESCETREHTQEFLVGQ